MWEIKTNAGKGRPIPMSATLERGLTEHLARHEKTCGPLQPDWFLFPSRTTFGADDPTRPVGR